jgi:hypothetical protein
MNLAVIARAALLVVLIGTPLWAQDQDPPAAQSKAERKREKRCASMPEEKRRQTDACKTDGERREDAYRKRIKEREEKEKAVHSSFLKWIHADGLWVPTESGGTTYGLVGMHVAVANIGRVYLYGPPGVMLLLEDTGRGRRATPAFTWGVSVYLIDFRVPGMSHTSQLFLDLAKCWTTGDRRTAMNMGGFSVTWKK